MSVINLNDAQYEVKSVKVFNGGVAGVVKNCGIRVERRKADEADTAPKYRVIVIDSEGAEVNKGYFGNFEKSSPKALEFFVKEMKHLAGLFKVELPATIDSYNSLLDITMRGCFENTANRLVNVAVSYGTTKYPNKYLQIASAFAITPITETPYLGPDALMVRPEPTQPATGTATAPTDDWGTTPAAPAAPKGDMPF